MFDSPWHWAVVAIVAFVLFFGWKNLPDMSRSLGRSLRIFKTEIKGMTQDDKDRAEAEAPKAIEGPAAQVQATPVVQAAPVQAAPVQAAPVVQAAPAVQRRPVIQAPAAVPRPRPRPNATAGAARDAGDSAR